MELRPPFEATRGSLDDLFTLHGDRRQLVFVERGRWYWRRRDGLSSFQAPFVLSVPGDGGRSTRPDAARGVLLSFSPRLAAELGFALGPDPLLEAREPTFIRLSAAETERCRGLFDDIAELRDGRRGDCPDLLIVKMKGLLLSLRRLRGAPGRGQIGVAPADRSPRAADATAILEYLKDRFREPLSLEEMAAELGYSPSYLSRYFKRKTGRCLFEYVNARRVAEACSLLKETDKTVTEIAFEVGYNNLSFFNRYFRRLMDSTPQAFRRRAKS